MTALGTFTQDKLIGGDFPLVTEPVTLLDGQTIARGALLGLIEAGTVPTTGTLVAGGSADGTLTVVTGGVNTVAGIYTVICIAALTNGGVFNVLDPDGKLVTTVEIVAGAGGTGVFVTPQLNGTITDGANDFDLGDYFTVTVPAGSGKAKLIDSAAIDGSGKPYCVSSEAAAPSGADAEITGYLTGQFNIIGLSVGGSDTVAQHKDAMRALSMFQRASVPE
jgi:hypothetical protein